MFDGESEITHARPLILIDTKYECGLDKDGVLHVIDEANAPDSSRLCDVEEWEGVYSRVATAIATGRYNTVTALLEVQPELKNKEFSKQNVRDALLDLGFNPAQVPMLFEHGDCRGCAVWHGRPQAAALASTTGARTRATRVGKPIRV